MIQCATHIAHFILQSMSADSVGETTHKRESSQNTTRSCVIAHIT